MSTQSPIDVNIPTYISEYQVRSITVDESYVLRQITHYANAAVDAIRRGDIAHARHQVDMALEYNNDAAVLWLLAAATAPTAADQLEAVNKALAIEPHNAEALRIKGELDGTIARMTAAPEDESSDDELRGEKITCPRCNGVLILREHSQEVICDHCGYQIADLAAAKQDVDKRALLFGMMRRQANPTDWNIGERWLRCTACNAHITFNRPALSQACRFCGSLAIVKETTNNRFEQPDLMVPFRLEDDDARQIVARVAEMPAKRGVLKRLFGDAPPEVDHIRVNGAYLPFWVIDADLLVRKPDPLNPNTYQQTGERLTMHNVLYFASSHLPRTMLDRIEPFDLYKGVPYDPHLLVEYPAELYDVDLDRAAIDVRDKIQARARTSPDVTREDLVQTQGMQYKLALLPVYVGHIAYRNGHRRRGVINGQTARVIFEQ
jgi:predicted RNA-binding Zn-ribbon protein involved in translation (DUF1610 family)